MRIINYAPILMMPKITVYFFFLALYFSSHPFTVAKVFVVIPLLSLVTFTMARLQMQVIHTAEAIVTLERLQVHVYYDIIHQISYYQVMTITFVIKVGLP